SRPTRRPRPARAPRASSRAPLLGRLALAADARVRELHDLEQVRDVDRRADGEQPDRGGGDGSPQVPDPVRVRLEEARAQRSGCERGAPGVEVDDRAPLREADVEEAVVEVRAVAEVERLAVLEPLGEDE